MKSRIIMGLLAATVAVAPVLAQHHTVTHGNVGSSNNHVQGSGVYCGDDDAFDNGVFTRWTHTGVGHTLFTCGGPGSDFDVDYVGLRLEATGLPARSFQVDWNLTNSDDAFFVIGSSSSSGVEVFAQEQGVFNSAGPGFTIRNVGNGYTRFSFNALNSNVGPRFGNIYLVDFQDGGSNTDAMTNIFVNGAAVVPNTHNTTQYDCSAEY